MNLKGKVAIVTGASRGIGKDIALGFSREGAHIVVVARSEIEKDNGLPGTIYKTAEEVQAAGRRALAIKCDVTNESNVNEMTKKIVEEFGRIDILVNNAAVAFYYPLLETPLKRWELVLRVNLVGPFLCSRAVLPQMIKQGGGSIINISSLAANEKDLGLYKTGIAYGASKAGLERFTWGLAAEVGQYNIAVNAIKPKFIIGTEGSRLWLKNAVDIQFKSSGKMVKSAIFLANQDAKGVTGVVATDEELCSWHGLL